MQSIVFFTIDCIIEGENLELPSKLYNMEA